MTKNVIVALAFVSCGALSAHTEAPIIDNLAKKVQRLEERVNAPIPEKAVAPELSPGNTALVEAIAQKLRISDYSLDFLASQEDWLNTFSTSERTYIIGSHLLMKEKFYKILYGDVLVVLAHHGLGIGGFLTMITYSGNSLYTMSPDKRAAITLGTLLSIGVACFITHKYVIEPLVGTCIQRLITDIDAQTVRELDCQEDALSALTKMGTTTYPLSKGTDRWLDAINFDSKYIQFDEITFAQRIEKLKALAAA